MRLRIFLAFGFVIAAALTLPVAAQRAASKRRVPSSQTRKAAVRTPSVREINAEALKKLLRREGRQSRPLLVNFWATWCDPCREEFPDLVKIDNEYRPRGLDFVTISLDDLSEINNQVPRFILKMGATAIPAYLLNVKDPETAISAVDKQWRGELPATFLFNRQGQIVFRQMGRIKPKELRKALDAVTDKTVTSDK